MGIMKLSRLGVDMTQLPGDHLHLYATHSKLAGWREYAAAYENSRFFECLHRSQPYLTYHLL